MSTSTQFGYEDYAALDDDKRYEVLDGELVPMGPTPLIRHQELVGNLYIKLADFLDRHPLGKAYYAPVDVVLKHERPGTDQDGCGSPRAPARRRCAR